MKLRVGVAAIAILFFAAFEGYGISVSINSATARIPLAYTKDKAPEMKLAAGERLLGINPEAYKELWSRGTSVVSAFPLPDGRTVDLELMSFDVRAHGAKYVVVKDKREREFTPPEMRFYRGRVTGFDGSLAYLWLSEGRMGGFIILGNEPQKLLFGPMDPTASKPLGRIHVISNGEGSTKNKEPFCKSERSSPIRSSLDLLKRDPIAAGITSTTLLEARIALDSNYEYYAHFGNSNSAIAYANALMGAVSTIYENEVNTLIQISYMRIFTTNTDPYTDNDVEGGIIAMENEWNSNPTLKSLPRTAVHLFTYNDESFGPGGIAELNAVCDDDYGFAASRLDGTYTYPNGNYTWDADVVSHELGHNFGSIHTHCYSPPIDCCYTQEAGCCTGPATPVTGTIMSYCHLPPNPGKNLIFSQRERDVIRPTIEGGWCVEVAGNPGDIRGEANALRVSRTNSCPVTSLATDTGETEFYYSISNVSWIKRFTPPCYPFELDRVDVRAGYEFAGRPLRLLVYSDTAGTGSPANSTLVHTQDVTLQHSTDDQYNTYTLTTPVILNSGHFYLGFKELDGQPMPLDVGTGPGNNSYYAIGSTNPSAYALFPFPDSTYTWLIRGRGGCVRNDCLKLTWGDACNAITIPGQDFGVYAGTFPGNFSNHQSVTCSTNKAQSFDVQMSGANQYFVVVPQQFTEEGSYGSGIPQAVSPCKPQAVEACP